MGNPGMFIMPYDMKALSENTHKSIKNPSKFGFKSLKVLFLIKSFLDAKLQLGNINDLLWNNFPIIYLNEKDIVELYKQIKHESIDS